MNLARGLKDSVKLKTVQMHRLLVYTQVFQEYCDGKTNLEHVIRRAQKVIDSGVTQKIGGGKQYFKKFKALKFRGCGMPQGIPQLVSNSRGSLIYYIYASRVADRLSDVFFSYYI